MSNLKPEHIDAVARVLHDENPNSGIPWGEKNGFHRSPYRVRARQILTSTDPDVHAALLAALVRAGVLERKWRNLRPCGCRAGSNALMCCDSEAPTTIQAQYVSKWEETCD